MCIPDCLVSNQCTTDVTKLNCWWFSDEFYTQLPADPEPMAGIEEGVWGPEMDDDMDDDVDGIEGIEDDDA